VSAQPAGAAAVAVCTRGGGAGLARTLAALDADAPAEAELLVVLSGADASAPTPPVLEAALGALGRSARMIVEPAPGAARARTRALYEATSDVVLFTDDDTVVRRGWYAALRAAMANGAGAAGGAVVAVWPDDVPPAWLPGALRSYYGERIAGPGASHRPFAANMALRRSAVDAVGGMRADLGPQGGRPGLHAETEVCERLHRAGFAVIEAPEATVEHVVAPDQVRLRWLLRRAWNEGRSDALRDAQKGRDTAVRTLKLAGLVASLPLTAGHKSRAVYVLARIVSNIAYLTQAARP
jgi:GT2 family glycosyltransferase